MSACCSGKLGLSIPLEIPIKNALQQARDRNSSSEMPPSLQYYFPTQHDELIEKRIFDYIELDNLLIEVAVELRQRSQSLPN
jgi:hypothetical protein